MLPKRTQSPYLEKIPIHEADSKERPKDSFLLPKDDQSQSHSHHTQSTTHHEQSSDKHSHHVGPRIESHIVSQSIETF